MKLLQMAMLLQMVLALNSIMLVTAHTVFIDSVPNGFRTNNNREIIHIGMETGRDKI